MIKILSKFDKLKFDYDNNISFQRDELKEREILNSWKEISEFLNRDIRTCRRWEKKFGLPVHRIDTTSPRSKVFAFKSEIQEWLRERANSKEIYRKSFFERRWVILGISFLALVLLTVFTSSFLRNQQPTSFSETPSIAIFPFKYLNASEYEKYFSEGITKELVDNLKRQNRFKVIPPSQVKKISNEDEKVISKEAGIDFILTGKIEKSENRIMIHAQLLNPRSQGIIWEGKYEGDLNEIFSIQENICSKVEEILIPEEEKKTLLIPSKKLYPEINAFDTYLKANYILGKLKEESPDPWKLYHQGKYYTGKWTLDSNQLAINLFHQALEIDNNFAPAYLGLAQCYSNYVNLFWDYDRKWLDKAEELVRHAQCLSPDLPEYFSQLIEILLLKQNCFNEEHLNEALELGKQGIEKYAHDPQLNSILGYCYFLKYGEEGIEEDFKKALEYKEKSFWLDPYTVNNIVYSEFLMLNGEFQEAIEVCTIIEKNDPSLSSRFRLGEIYYYFGDLERSEEIFNQLENMGLGYKIGSLLYLGMIHAQRGNKEEALNKIEETKLISPPEFIVEENLRRASIYMGLGMKEKGYECLSHFFEKPRIKKNRFIFKKYIEIDRNFERVKNEERFKKIIKGEEKWPEAR